MNHASKDPAEQAARGASEALLSTKLTPPRLRGPLVTRETLYTRLDEGLERGVMLLSAPAGSGKTTLVRSWMAARPALPPVAWVALDAGDNDPVRFWRYVLTACASIQPDLGQETLETLLHASQPAFEGALTLFINTLAQLPGRALLVLEEYHTITSPRVHETLAFLLDYLPETLCVVLITRSDPPLPLAHWRVRGDLCELRAADLRFSPQETQQFFQHALPIPLAPETLAQLDERIEGWVAGLHLLTLAAQGRHDPYEIEHILTNITGSHQHILEYLVADVLRTQPDEVQTFLLQTSLFSRLNASLCAAVTGCEESTRLLTHLDQANLFLYPLEGAGQWYRYHALFAEAMQHEARRRFDEEMVRELFARASHWYEAHGLLVEAIDTDLAVRQFSRAAQLMERFAGPQQTPNEVFTLFHRLEQLPEEQLQMHPELCLIYATAILFLTDRRSPTTRAQFERPLRMAERVWQAEGKSAKLGEVEALRASSLMWQSDFVQGFQVSRRALELLPAWASSLRGACLINIGTAALWDGRADEAKQLLLEAHRTNTEVRNDYGARASLLLLGAAHVAQGELHLAAQLYQQVFTEAEACNDFVDTGTTLQYLATLAYEWNDLETAQQQATLAKNIFQRFPDDEMLVKSALVLAQLQQARGATAQAQQDLTALAARVQRWPHLLRSIYSCQSRLALAAGDLETARQRAVSSFQYSDSAIFLQQEEDALLSTRLLIAGGENAEALRLLLIWQEEAQIRRQTHTQLEILVLQALAHHASRETTQAYQVLHQALTLARAENYQRLFLDEGPAMYDLLRTLLPTLHEEPLKRYTRELLLAATHEKEAPGTPIASTGERFLLEPLSPQEKRVLRLLVVGFSNPEIARELVVSVNTIKTQVQSIYFKLGVNNRQEAREEAHKLHLV